MQSQSSLLDDVARLMTGAMGVAQGVGEEAKTFVRTQADRFVADMDLVTREEFELQKELLEEARAEIEALKTRLAALEGK
jgi:BMFP domain-containing protein YqiC